MRILCIEDHRDTAVMMRKLLAAAGHDVVIASTLAAGRLAVASGGFDLILCDLMLPDGDGCELIRDVRRKQTPPAIAVTAAAFERDIARTRAAGFDAHVCKPFKIQGLMRAIDEATCASAPVTGCALD